AIAFLVHEIAPSRSAKAGPAAEVDLHNLPGHGYHNTLITPIGQVGTPPTGSHRMFRGGELLAQRNDARLRLGPEAVLLGFCLRSDVLVLGGAAFKVAVFAVVAGDLDRHALGPEGRIQPRQVPFVDP